DRDRALVREAMPGEYHALQPRLVTRLRKDRCGAIIEAGGELPQLGEIGGREQGGLVWVEEPELERSKACREWCREQQTETHHRRRCLHEDEALEEVEPAAREQRSEAVIVDLVAAEVQRDQACPEVA